MKKNVFTLMMMVVLVAVTNVTFAQSSYDAPYVGAEQIYRWGNVTTTTYSYAVTTSSVSPTSSPAVEDTDFEVSTGALTGGGALTNESSADLGLTWLTPSVGNTYYVWLVATSADGCENWRYVTVLPEANKVDFILAALGLYTKAEAIATLEGAAPDNGGDACPTPALRDGTDYSSDAASAGDDGDVYAYFRVSQGADNNNDTWAFAFGIVTDPTTPAGTIEYYNGTAWVAYTTAITGIADNAVQLLRVMIPTPLATATTATTITGTISGASEVTTGLLDTDSSNDVQAFTVNRVAAIGGFTGN